MLKTADDISFEDALKELEEIINEIENNEPALSIMIKKYTRGIELSKKCLNELQSAEKTIDLMLSEENGSLVEQEFHLKEDKDV